MDNKQMVAHSTRVSVKPGMSDKRKGEIAMLFLKYKLRKDGVHLSTNTPREIGNVAKALAITPAEASEFAEILVRELVDSVFLPGQWVV